MRTDTRPRRPWRAALAAFAATALTLGIVALLALTLASNAELDRTAAPVAGATDRAAAAITTASVPRARAALRGVGAPARLVAADGAVIAQTAAASPVWSAGGPGWFGRLAAVGADGWALRDGAVQTTAVTPTGATVVVRAPLAAGAASLSAVRTPLLVVILLLSLAAAVATWVLADRRARRLSRLSVAAEAISAGRAATVEPEGRGEIRRLSEAMAGAAARAATLQTAAESRMEALGAALAPLPMPVAARTPSGGLVRNDALDRLVAGLTPADAGQVEDAVRSGLTSSGAVSQRLSLSDDRALEVEAWPVPGGRMVAVGERTEQARMEAVRRQVTGSAARQLHTPIAEIRTLTSDLIGQVPSSAAPTVRRIQAAGDRMDRLVGQLLRGTANDPRPEAPRLRAVGAAGLAYGLGAQFDRRLRDRGLRLETDLPRDLPPIRTDPALLTEILSELIGNSAMFTPRGGTITLAGRQRAAGVVELSVADTGPGVPSEELDLVVERFGRGAGANGFPGAGLGLGVASALAERLGGRLTIEAGPAGRARLELPAAPAAPPADGDDASAPAASLVNGVPAPAP